VWWQNTSFNFAEALTFLSVVEQSAYG